MLAEGKKNRPVSPIFGVCTSGTGQQERTSTAPLPSEERVHPVAIVGKPKMSAVRK